jgi:hypothetical protein
VTELPDDLEQRIHNDILEAASDPIEVAAAARSCQAIIIILLALALVVCLVSVVIVWA